MFIRDIRGSNVPRLSIQGPRAASFAFPSDQDVSTWVAAFGLVESHKNIASFTGFKTANCSLHEQDAIMKAGYGEFSPATS
jgi:hypothetical protein